MAYTALLTHMQSFAKIFHDCFAEMVPLRYGFRGFLDNPNSTVMHCHAHGVFIASENLKIMLRYNIWNIVTYELI